MLYRLVILCLLLSLTPFPPALAQDSTPGQQTFENIVYLVDDPQITMLVSMGVTGPTPEPLTWLIPVPAEPSSVSFAPADALAQFEYSTEPYPEAPYIPCQLSKRSSVAGGDYRFPPPQIVGAEMQDYGVFSAASEREVVAGIRAAGFPVDDWMAAAIQDYLPDTYFVVLRAAWPEVDAGDIEREYRLPLVVVSYEADALELLLPTEQQDIPVTAWIVGDSQYAPQGYAAPIIPEWSAIQGSDHQVRSMGYLVLRQLWGDHAHLDYPRVRSRTQHNAGPGTFLTEYAGNLDGGFRNLFPADLLPDGFTHEYVTRLRTENWAGELEPITALVPAPDFADVPRFVNLNVYVDPLAYWGCSSETIFHPALHPDVPEAHTRIDPLRMDVAHPAGWVLSDVAWQDNLTLYVIAPEPVSAAMMPDFFVRGSDQPFFLAFEVVGPPNDDQAGQEYDQYWYSGAANDAFTALFGMDMPGITHLRYWPYGGDDCALERAVAYGFFSPGEDRRAIAEQYSGMLTYAGKYQFFASADLPHTLFLNDDFGGEGPILMVPYPAGWTPRLDAKGNVHLAPNDDSVQVIIEWDDDALAVDGWSVSVEGDSARWERELGAIRDGITTDSGCRAIGRTG